jgi:Tfp pilus assembly protein PilN
MSNLLTEKDLIGLKKEKKARLINVALIFFSFSFWICAFALSPRAYVILTDYQKLKTDLAKTKTNPAAISFINLQQTVASTKKQMDSAQTVLKNRPYFSKILPQLLNDKPKGVSITSISFTRASKDDALYINGTASSRDALRQFSANLKSNSEFSDVDVPVSNFAKSKENDFSITLKLVKKNDK